MKKIIIIGIILLILVTIVATIKINYNSKDIKLIISINNEEIDFSNLSENNLIDIKTLNSEFDTIVEIKEISDNLKVKINGKVVENNEINLGIVDINKDNKIKVEAYYNWFTKTEYEINTLPSKMPEYEVSGESEYEGDYYFTTYYGKDIPNYLMKLDEKGNLIYYKETDELSFDFKKETTEDKVRYTYLTKPDVPVEIHSSTYVFTELIVMDEQYNVIDKVRYQMPDGKEKCLDNHDTIFIDDGHYIITSYDEKEVTNIPKEIETNTPGTANVCSVLIQEIKDGKVLWSFETADYPELYTYCVEEMLESFKSTTFIYADYAHINSMAIDPKDNNLLCSFRNIDTILKIDRKTGKIVWKLGGDGDEFGLTEEQKFARQHSISFKQDGSMLIYDNGNENERTRVINLKIDEENKKLEWYKEYDLGMYASAMGSVQYIQDNMYVICYGMEPYDKKYSIEEIDLETKEVYFKFKFNYTLSMYNVYKIK